MDFFGSNKESLFERLTCIDSIERDSGGDYLLIDRPDGFTQSAAQTEAWNLRFNLINISLGGAFGVLRKNRPKTSSR